MTYWRIQFAHSAPIHWARRAGCAMQQGARKALKLLFVGLSGLLHLTAGPLAAAELQLRLLPETPTMTAAVRAEGNSVAPPTQPKQLPQSRVAKGNKNIALAYLAEPTSRYPHGVLGDREEAAALVVEVKDGMRLRLDLPRNRVFEDLEPRLVDLDGNGRDEILLVESDERLGASLAVYGVREHKLDRSIVLLARSPFIGTAFRWLNPLGVGDFDGDGRADIALVATPHIGGVLQIYRYTRPTLTLIAETPNISTHRSGSTELGLGAIVKAPAIDGSTSQTDRILAPNQSHRQLRLLALSGQRLVELDRTHLDGTLSGALQADPEGGWHFQLNDGRRAHIAVKP